MILKRVLWVVLGCIGLFVLTILLLVLREPKPLTSAPLNLPNGDRVRIIGVTYGTNHVVGSALARLIGRMPPAPQSLMKRVIGARAFPQGATITSEPKLIIWLQRATNSPPPSTDSGYLTAVLSDTNGFCSGDQAFIHSWWANPQDVQFPVFPRRDPLIAVNFFYHSPTGGVTRCGSLPFSNPRPGKFAQWRPEPLPATRTVGDVAATLEKLSTGHDQNRGYASDKGGGKVVEFSTSPKDGRNETVCAIRFRPLKNTNEVWVVANEEVSDATGNKAKNTSLGWGSYEEGYLTFEPGLWPSETAWKLRCEIKRAEGFIPGETFTFRDVPLGRLEETNRIAWTTNFGGVRVTLDHILRRPPNTNDSWSSTELSEAQFATAGVSDGLHLDLLSARTDDGTKLNSGSWSSSGGWRSYTFRNIPLEARTVDFTFAVQRGQWVEFTVKPEVGPLKLSIKAHK